MAHYVCPAAMVAAPVKRIWRLLTSDYWAWADGRVEWADPPGPAVVGQRLEFSTRELAITFRIRFSVEVVDHEKYVLGLHVAFPFGLQLRDRISCAPMDGKTRVQYG